jgi:hypothetical protein
MSDDKARGRAVLAAQAKIINNGAIVVQDEIARLLETGTWRSYTYPSGDHHEWLVREFDYFMSAWLRHESKTWDDVKANIWSEDVKAMLAKHHGGQVKADERRTPEKAGEQVVGGVEAIRLTSEDRRRIAHKGVVREPQKTITELARPQQKRWIVTTKGDLASAIVAKLLRQPNVAKDVYRKLHSVYRPDSKKAG